jgi:hypothetical protein
MVSVYYYVRINNATQTNSKMELLTLNILMSLGFYPTSKLVKNFFEYKDFALTNGKITVNSFNYGKAFRLNNKGHLGKRIKYVNDLCL